MASLPTVIACRFTWELIRRSKRGRAIILTTHSMEEADLLCDKIAIMAEGDLAAVGTAMDLKQRFGVGYRLTVVQDITDRPVSNSAETVPRSVAVLPNYQVLPGMWSIVCQISDEATAFLFLRHLLAFKSSSIGGKGQACVHKIDCATKFSDNNILT